MAAARALGMEGVDGPPLEGGYGVLDKAAFVERVGVDHHLHVHPVRHRQAAVDGGGRGAPILMQLERGGPGLHHFDDGRSEEHTTELQSLMRTSYAVL